MRYISLFSGFGGAELAWGGLGWECTAVAEIDPPACAVLAARWPEIPNLGNVQAITRERIEDLGPIDLVVFGSPCQDLSVAGKRKGLKGERSGLFFDAMRIVRWANARFALWENVPGAFSSHNGRDFALVVGEMAGVQPDVPDGGWANSGFLLGPDGLVEWAVLDAQFFGVPQRRRRIFALRDTGDWQSRPPILLERESLCGYPPPSREARQNFTHELAPSLTSSGRGVERGGDSRGQDPVIAVASTRDTSHCLNGGGMGRQDYETETLIAFSAKDHGADAGDLSPTLRAGGFDKSHANSGNWAAVAFSNRGNALNVPETLRADCNGALPMVAFTQNTRDEVRLLGGDGQTAGSLGAELGMKQQTYMAVAFEPGSIARNAGPRKLTETVGTQRSDMGDNQPAVMQSMQVRRLTPIETARLQGVSDDHCRIPYKGRMMADGPIYKMHGNGFAVPVVRWIGQRIEEATR